MHILFRRVAGKNALGVAVPQFLTAFRTRNSVCVRLSYRVVKFMKRFPAFCVVLFQCFHASPFNSDTEQPGPGYDPQAAASLFVASISDLLSCFLGHPLTRGVRCVHFIPSSFGFLFRQRAWIVKPPVPDLVFAIHAMCGPHSIAFANTNLSAAFRAPNKRIEPTAHSLRLLFACSSLHGFLSWQLGRGSSAGLPG